MPEITGLTSYDAEKRLQEYGPNVLPEKRPPSGLKIFLSQLKSPLVYVLVFASLVTLFLGHYNDSAVIGVAIFLNTILGFFQERRAENALFALKKLIQPRALVIRDGKRKDIDATSIVPGDVCVLNSGDKVPADGKLYYANRLHISEAILTGESVPITKENGDSIFMGTVVTSGQGRLVVEKTGKNTEIGKIAEEIQEIEEVTPLKKQLTVFSRQLTYVVILLTFFVFVSGIILGKDIIEIFTTSVALAVSAIPEGLLVGLTVVLAIGMQRILTKKGLVRNLVSAETLGSVTTICLDKTGTLTEGKMQVVEVVGNKKDIALQAILANDLDDPIVFSLWEWAAKNLTGTNLSGENIDEFIRENERIDSIPFSPKERFFASLNLIKGHRELLINGAPEYLLEWSNLSAKEKLNIKKRIDSFTSQGRRLIAMARKRLPNDVTRIDSEKVKKGLNWIGFIALTDPVREGVKGALEKTKIAGIKLVVITGDYAQTAVYVLNELGLTVSEDRIIMGDELEKMEGSGLAERLERLMADSKNAVLFARTNPEQKLKIVEALRMNNEIIAMLGDGVNDAPALKAADIGIVVGSASEVAKESSDLVLLDSSFSTVVSAVEEGRGIFNNLRKIVLYLMSDAFSEIIAVIGSIILVVPLPLTAAQILWINLVSDGLPHLALTVDPKDKDIMRRSPRLPNENLISDWMKRVILFVSVTGGLFGLFLFLFYYNLTADLLLSQSIAFAALGINTLIYVFSIRALDKSIWKIDPFENKWLNIAVLGGLILQIFPFLFEGTRSFLGLKQLDLSHWTVIFLSSFFMLTIIEVLKIIFRSNLLQPTNNNS